MFSKIEDNSFDLITDFSSFGEMPEKFFDYINDSNLQDIYTVNRLDSFPMKIRFL